MGALSNARGWRAFVCCIFLGGSTGFYYAFSTWSQALKTKFGLQQSQLDNIGTLPYLVGLLSPIWGWITDSCGPEVAVALGIALQIVALAANWLVASGRADFGIDFAVHKDALVAVMVMFGCVKSVGCAAVTGAVFATTARVFPMQRGEAVGIAKAWCGLASGEIAQLMFGIAAIMGPRASALNIMVVQAILILAIGIPSVPLLRSYVRDKRRGSRSSRGEGGSGADDGRSRLLRSFTGDGPVLYLSDRNIRLATAHIVVMTVLLVAASLAQGTMSSTAAQAMAAAVFVVYVAPAAVTACTVCRSSRVHARALDADADEGAIARLKDPLMLAAAESGEDSHARWRQHALSEESEASAQSQQQQQQQQALDECDEETELPEMTVRQMLTTLDCWVLLSALSFIIGGGFIVLTNAGQIVVARGLPQDAATAAVSIFSAAQALGRLGGGVLSDAALRRGVPRPVALACAAAVMCVGHALLLIPTSSLGHARSLLYVACCVIGVPFGALWPLAVVLVSELFGLRYMASCYMFYDGTAALIGSVAIGNFLTAQLYQQNVPAGEKNCVAGAACFRVAHITACCMLAVACALALLLARRKRALYRTYRLLMRSGKLVSH